MDINNTEFNNILSDNIETPIKITFSTSSQVFSIVPKNTLLKMAIMMTLTL